MSTYSLTTEVWEIDEDDFPSESPIEEQARFLLRYAILAPSSHNSQPWEFSIDDGSIQIYAAEDRWLEVADHDKRELYISLGCAVENLCIAAEHFGFGFDIEYHDDATPVTVVTLEPEAEPSSERRAGLFDAITQRYTNHNLFRDEPLAETVRERLRDCVIEDDVTLVILSENGQKEPVAELQAEADRIQMEDPDYRRELGYWIGIGALGDSWLTARIGQAVVTHLDIGGREAKRNSKLIQSAPNLGVLLAGSDALSARVRTGHVFERLSLAATAEGIAVHPMSQILERPKMRGELAVLIGCDELLPQHLFRLGYATEEQEHTPRWPLESFLVE